MARRIQGSRRGPQVLGIHYIAISEVIDILKDLGQKQDNYPKIIDIKGNLTLCERLKYIIFNHNLYKLNQGNWKIVLSQPSNRTCWTA